MPVSPYDLFGEARVGMSVFEGTISRAITSRLDDAYATSPQMPGVEFGPMSWQRDGTHFPEVGNRCILAKPQGAGNEWIIAWEPSA